MRLHGLALSVYCEQSSRLDGVASCPAGPTHLIFFVQRPSSIGIEPGYRYGDGDRPPLGPCLPVYHLWRVIAIMEQQNAFLSVLPISPR
jgi:hypothetical protein